MCGIIGYIGDNECVDLIVNGLKRLEYRGYDSSGVASWSQSSKIYEIVKSEGKLENVEMLLKNKHLSGNAGIGHTRWATHGKPNTINAHPHRTGKTILVHNGIIENYDALRTELKTKGYKIISDTDSELFGHLVEDQQKQGVGFIESVRTAFLRLQGSCSIVVGNDDHPDTIIAIRNGTPLVAAHSKNSKGSFVASDAQAIIEHTRDIIYLENEDMVVLTKSSVKIYSLYKPITTGSEIHRETVHLDWELSSLDKAGFQHFMLKEIYEQPRAILDTLDHLMDRDTGQARFDFLESTLLKIKKIQIVACGTAFYASMTGKYVIEKIARIPVEIDLANEYRYRDPIIGPETLFIVVSQSGETADTLAALREAKKRGATTLAICNVRGSTIAREAHFSIFTAAGPEIGVASTKAFTTQMLVLLMIAQYAAKNSNKELIDLHFFLKLPHMIQNALSSDPEVLRVAKACMHSKGFLYIGRGRLYPIALEGALKMKEISYIHAEGYPAGELKHGPIAMVDESMTVVVFAPRDELYEKTISNLQEVKARGGRIIGIGSKGDTQLQQLSDHFLGYDFAADWSDLFLSVIPAQLLAYHTAVLKGTDVDKPRNLAKSVTVE